MSTILLATDGSTHDRSAATQALDLAEEEHGSVHVVCVVDERRFANPALSTTELVTISAEDRAHLFVTDVTQMAEDREIDIHGEVRYGLPETVILEYADEVDADVIVLDAPGGHEVFRSRVGRTIAENARQRVVTAGAETA